MVLVERAIDHQITIRFHRFSFLSLVTNADVWRQVSTALDKALVDPSVDGYAPRCVFNAASTRFPHHEIVAEALRYMAVVLWSQGEQQQRRIDKATAWARASRGSRRSRPTSFPTR